MDASTPTPPRTERQRAMLAYLTRYHAQHGFMPTLREIGEACADGDSPLSTSVVSYNLFVLQQLGHITGLVRGLGKGKARAWRLVVQPEPDVLTIRLPADPDHRRALRGRIAMAVRECAEDMRV